MPRLDGFDTVERLRADPRTHDLKIAMVTACAQADDLRRGDAGRRRRLRHQAVRPERAGAHGPRPGRAPGRLTSPDSLDVGDSRRALRRRPGRRAGGRRRGRPGRPGAGRGPGRAAARSRSTATTRPRSRCSWPSRPAGRRARSPRRSPPGCGEAAGVAAVDVAGPGLPQHHPRLGRPGRARPDRGRGGRGLRPQRRRSPGTGSTSSSSPPTRPGRCTSGTSGGRRWATRSPGSSRPTGAEVTREYYFNDAGVQIDRFALSLLAAAKGEPTPEDGYGGAYIGEIAAQVVAADPTVLDLDDDEASRRLPARRHGADVRRDPPVAGRLRRALRRLLQREGPARQG